VANFESAYNDSRLGRPEVVEQLAANSPALLSDQALSMDEKSSFYNFAKDAVIKINDTLPNDARYYILAGSFLARTGQIELAQEYFKKAEALMPQKQMIYFEHGGALVNAGDFAGAKEQFKKAYDLAPEYAESKVIYLAGAILTGDRNLEEKLKSEIPHETYISDDRVVGSYLQASRYSELLSIFKERVTLNPKDAQQYISLAVVYVKMGDKSDAIATLNELARNIPEQKTNVDAYIRGIEDGSIK
jgi:tetratricopeptide (TPR) repeat protein